MLVIQVMLVILVMLVGFGGFEQHDEESLKRMPPPSPGFREGCTCSAPSKCSALADGFFLTVGVAPESPSITSTSHTPSLQAYAALLLLRCCFAMYYEGCMLPSILWLFPYYPPPPIFYPLTLSPYMKLQLHVIIKLQLIYSVCPETKRRPCSYPRQN